MESLLGHLSHAALVILPGRLYLHQLFALLMPSARDPHHHIRLNASVWADIMWWDALLCDWNRVSFFHSLTPSVHIFSNPLGTFGCGTFNPSGTWFRVHQPQHWMQDNIATKGLVPLVLAAALWGVQWKGCHMLFHVDNMAVVASVQRLNARDHSLGQFLRCLHFLAARFGFTFTATHIPGIQNAAADTLSRGDFSLFHSLFPQAPEASIPHHLLNAIAQERPDRSCPHWMQQFRGCWNLESHPPQQQHTERD